MSEILHTRRVFLQTGLTVLSAASTVPLFIQRTAYAVNDPADSPLTQRASGKDGTVLVIIQLSGGNDGLSTVIPKENDDYRKARPATAITQDLLSLAKNSDVAFNPNLKAFKELYDDGNLALIQGVGYPNPDRSHFRSMEIWHTAEPTKPPKNGWLGRYFDAQCSGVDPKTAAAKEPDPKAAINIGATAPLALQGDKFAAVSFQRPENYQWFAGNRNVDRSMKETFSTLNDLDPQAHPGESMNAPAKKKSATLDFLERTVMDAQLSSDEIRNVTSRYRGGVSYPGNDFGRQLQMVAQMIAGGLSTRVYYVSLGGFDTHSNMNQQHNRLMQVLSEGVSAFTKDLKSQGNFDRVMVVTFSEFGRRVTENASRGTDHGTAAPMFVFGGKVKGGVQGRHPSLRPEDLDRGDLKFHTDFRSVYATVLGNWLKTDSAKILGGGFRTLPIIG